MESLLGLDMTLWRAIDKEFLIGGPFLFRPLESKLKHKLAYGENLNKEWADE